MNIAAVAVVVPAHNEAEHIVACVRSIRAAAGHVGPLPMHTVVVADACTDITVALAAREGAHTVSVDRRNVGAARGVGVLHALALPGSTPGIRLAMTDADSTVPTHWLTRRIAWARRGHDAVLGTIRLAPASQGACRYARSEHDAAYYRTRSAAAATAFFGIRDQGAGLRRAAFVNMVTNSAGVLLPRVPALREPRAPRRWRPR